MHEYPPMVGRDEELTIIRTALAECRRGECAPILISGEAGIGKSHLIAEGIQNWDGLVLRAATYPGSGIYAPVSRMLRTCRDSFGKGIIDPAANVLLSSAQTPSAIIDTDVLADGIAATVRSAADRSPAVVVLEDVHWASAAAIDIVTRITAGLAGAPVLIVLSYRSDELARSHPVRTMRAELRRTGPLIEVALAPVSESETAELISSIVGTIPSAPLARAVHERAGGSPFFVRELTTALADGEGLTDTDSGVDLSPGAAVPMPESIVDAILIRTKELLDSVGEAVEVAAVLGVNVDLELLADLVPPDQVDNLLESSLLIETDTGAEFRHALVRDALYRTIPWARRRAHHQRVAEAMTVRDVPPDVIARHWLSAHDNDRAQPLLLAAAERFCRLRANRDAADVLRRAVAIWPADDDGRTDTLERLADCDEMCGEVAEAADTWEEVAERRRAGGDKAREGVAQRRLANAADMLGNWERAVTARDAAATAFSAAGQPDKAASEHLVLAEQLEAAAQQSRALDHVKAAVASAEAAGRIDLKAHALSLQGVIVAALGDVAVGLEISRSGVALALDRGFTDATGSGYYDLASTLIYASDYMSSAETWGMGADFCHTHGLTDQGKGCLACMAVAVRFLGDWDRALEIAGEVLHDEEVPPSVRMVAQEEFALIHALRGKRKGVKSLLQQAASSGREAGLFGVEIGALWGIAAIADANDDGAEARHRSQLLVERCEEKEPSHFALPALRWAATCFSRQSDDDNLSRCHRLLGRYSTDNSSPKVLSTLAHAGGEVSLCEREPERAAHQFRRSLELIGHGAFPLDTALTQLRLGDALAGLGDRRGAVETISAAYRTARQLRAMPVARHCAEDLDAMGEKVDRRLGRLAARALEPAGLTRREQQILRLVARGDTNRNIADELYISVRTVDMHVRNLLSKLDCASRAAATRRAVELGLVDATTGETTALST